MIAGDYTVRKRVTNSGEIVIARIVKSTTGVEYAIGKEFDHAAVGTFYRAIRLRDKKKCVFKAYNPSPEGIRVNNTIKKNIEKLMRNPLTEEDGVTPLRSFVGPLDEDSLIELPASKSFGYIMELFDIETFLTVPKLWRHDTYPDADVLCKACINIAKFFRRVHFSGWCYMDINEGNIYINNKTGDICIIDCDNISTKTHKIILGTAGYMAPELYEYRESDLYSNYYSMAVLFYRLFIGGWPMDGRKTQNYLLKNDLCVQEAAATIYGKMALFVFDPNDNSNEIRNLKDPLNPNLHKIQTQGWDRLPAEIRGGFIQTFSTGLSYTNRHKRATDRDWIKIFEKLLTAGLVRCQCKRINFGDEQKEVECIFCKAILPPLKTIPPEGNLTT